MPTDFELIKKKITRFCAWRERCSKEVFDKLFDLGLNTSQANDILEWLIEERFVDDQRFASIFVRSKLNNNFWGKIKLRYELKFRDLSESIIENAMQQIDQEAYFEIAVNLVKKKTLEIKDSDPYVRNQKVLAYMSRKGFETPLIYDAIDQVDKN